jgi:hypothetical protein
MDALRDFLHEKIGWNRDKFNSVVTPVLERFKDKQVYCSNIFNLWEILIFFTFSFNSVKRELILTFL